MKLLFNHASPFARKCRVLAIELDVAERIDWQDVGAVSPLERNDYLFAHNPLGKLPALKISDRQVLCDSRVICEYLLEFECNFTALAKRELHFEDLHLQALADGLMDAALLIRYEVILREPNHQWQAWQKKQWFRIDRVLSDVEANLNDFERDGFGYSVLEGRFTLGQIALVCALGYLVFRFPQYKWRDEFVVLSSWFDVQSTRKSVKQTAPY